MVLLPGNSVGLIFQRRVRVGTFELGRAGEDLNETRTAGHVNVNAGLRSAIATIKFRHAVKIALDNLDDVVALIRKSKDPAEAKDGLMSEFGLSEVQAKAILEMRLQRLTGLEQQKILDDLAAVLKEIKGYENILANEDVKLTIIKQELADIRDKYGDDRRTEIVLTEEADIDIEDLIPDEDMVITYSRSGYIKRQSTDNYRAQRRGGRGIKGMGVNEEDVVHQLFIASNLDYLLIFTSIGKVHWLKVYNIPEAGRTAKGKSIANLLHLQPGRRCSGTCCAAGTCGRPIPAPRSRRRSSRSRSTSITRCPRSGVR